MGSLQILLLTISITMFVLVIVKVKKNNMNVRYSIIWIVWSVVLIFLSLFPTVIAKISQLLSIATPVNALFLIMIFLLYCLTFYVYLKISKHNEEIVVLNYEIAALKKKVEELESKK